MKKPTQKLQPHLWFVKEAVEAAKFYTSLFPDSRITRVSQLPAESPSGPPGSVDLVEFELFGMAFQAISAGPLDPFNHSISFIVNCDTQAEIDRYWNALLEGGKAEQCGWLQDRYGVSWQILPSMLSDMLADPDRAKAKRVAEVMLKMVKLEIDPLMKALGK
ncbi:MAG: VOC family protein [Kofleriaceae bacterium]|nr:VOC family protein [Kofleriaceae bacterium]